MKRHTAETLKPKGLTGTRTRIGGFRVLSDNQLHYKTILRKTQMSLKEFNDMADMFGWPSGLRRQLKALFSSEARVRTPLRSLFL